MRRIAIPLIGIVLLALAGVAYADLSRSGSPPRGGASISASGGRGSRLAISGHVNGLFPGARKRLRLRVKNRLPVAVVLHSIKTAVSDAGPGCARSNLAVGRYRGSLRIEAHRSRRVRVRVAMSGGAPDPCQGARFPLRYRARATG
jgi:hypothetical protein